MREAGLGWDKDCISKTPASLHTDGKIPSIRSTNYIEDIVHITQWKDIYETIFVQLFLF